MTPRQLHHLLIAPELIVVDLVEAALVALERALLVEHPPLLRRSRHAEIGRAHV